MRGYGNIASYFFAKITYSFMKKGDGNMVFNYAIIILGGIRIEGWTDSWEVPNNGTVNVKIDGVFYKVGVNNIILMHKDQEES